MSFRRTISGLQSLHLFFRADVIVLCEGGTMPPCVHGLTGDGRIFRFARNNIKITEPRNGLTGDFSQREFAGATYSPDGKWLFFNAQTPGVTFAVTGPWADGGL
jgi:hypothetical protein